MATRLAGLDNRDQFLATLAKAQSITDDLFRMVNTKTLYDRPIPERHRIVFYIGHLEAFDWNLIAGQALGLGPSHPEFDRLFAFGIDPVGGGLPTDQPSDWPHLPEIDAYNLGIRQKLDQILGDKSSDFARSWKYPRETILNVAIEHRLMHAETLAYMLHQLPVGRKVPPPDYVSVATAEPALPVSERMIDIPAGDVTLGIPRGREGFGWDNEFDVHSVHVPAFAIDARKVTNGEFLKFMQQGGYQDQRFWSDADWAWVQENGVSHPHFWFERQGQWFYRAMFEEVPLPLGWPVYVSHAEASAYARFVGKSLPSEAQFHRAVYATPQGVEREFPWGDAPASEVNGNFNFQHWDPVNVGSYPGGRSAFGLEDALGNGWEWTTSLFQPFPGFEPFPFYPGYSANFFDAKHYVMKGASPRTAACMLRRSFRNWFQPHYPFVYASFRCTSN
jgi:ergothioneine biosynthesis protein EgtB